MRISASKLSLLSRCAYTARPDVQVPWTESGPAAKRGTARHAVYERVVNGEEPRAEDMAAGEINTAHVERFRAWWIATGFATCRPITEQAFAFDPRTGKARALPRGQHRAYNGVRDGEIVGTADVVCLDGCDVVAIDFKTGRAANVEAAEDSEQVRALAAWAWECASVLWPDCKPIRGATRIIAHVADDGDVTATSASGETDEHEDALASLVQLAAIVPAAVPVTGEHCRDLWCPLLGRGCPAADAALVPLRAVVHQRAALPPIPEPTTNQEAAALVTALPHLEAWIKAARGAAERYADEHGGVDLGASVWRAVTTSRETVDADAAAPILVGRGLGAALSYTTSKAAIERASKANGDRGAIDELRAAGAIRSSTSTTHREVRKTP